MVRFPAKTRDFCLFRSTITALGSIQPSTHLSGSEVVVKNEFPAPPIPHTPSRRSREKRYLLPAYFLSGQKRSSASPFLLPSSITSALMCCMVFFWYVYNFLVLQCSDFIIFTLFQVVWMFIFFYHFFSLNKQVLEVWPKHVETIV